MASKGNLDATGHSTASRRRAWTPMELMPPHDWLAQLNDLIGVASRRLFQSQLVLRAVSEREIRAQLPELCAFSTSVCRAAAVSSEQQRAIRLAFSDPQAQWLSRGAVESGASGFFCHLLLRETAASDGEDGDDEASRCIVELLLDPVLSSCCDRIRGSNTHRACEWRFEKPQYYAMPCANLWETLLPFLARAARQHPTVFGNVLRGTIQATRSHVHDRVNCRFAQVAGFWRLLEAVGDAKSLHLMPQVHALLPTILAFAVRWSVLREQGDIQDRDKPSSAAASDASSDPHAKYYDLLMEKFFHDMQAFLFKCPHATRVTRIALRSILKNQLSKRSTSASSVERVRMAAFASAACFLVKGLGKETSELIQTHRTISMPGPDDGSFLLTVGLVAHTESIGVETVLSVLHELLDQYDALSLSPTPRREMLLWIIYVIVSRQRSLNPSDNSESPRFVHLQERICGVAMDDLQLMPLHWMEIVWKVLLGMQDDPVEAFTEEARAFRVALVQPDDGNAPPVWEDLIRRVPSRRLDQYSSIVAILGAHFVDSIKQTDLPALGEDGIEKVSRKKRRRLRRDVVVLSEEHEASRQNALLLPEVMERIASFMSAKRLCRLALVCRPFAGVARSARLWRPLYEQLVKPLNIKCRHGASYDHDWRLMFQAKYTVIKKMQNRQRAVARKARGLEGVTFGWHEDNDEESVRMRVAIHSAHLCPECGCNQLFANTDAAQRHRVLHQKHRCPTPQCRDALVSAAALKQHVKIYHPSASTAEHESKREKTEFKCTGAALDWSSVKVKKPQLVFSSSRPFDMTRKVADDVLTTDVVWAAARRIGKASNAQEIQRICDYLISKHWFQTAGDLRVARQNTQEWLSLEVPSRLKIAIQDELDASLEGSYLPVQDESPPMPYEECEDAVGQLTEADQSALHDAFYNSAPSSEIDVGTMGLEDAAAVAAAHAAAWEAYYASNGYDAYETTEQTTNESWDSLNAVQQDSDDVVEAQEVLIEEAEVAELRREEDRESMESVPVSAETWSCGQCTFLNRIDVSFCEICCGHISLSPDSEPSTLSLSETSSGEVSHAQDSYPASTEIHEFLVSPDPVAPVAELAVMSGRVHALEIPLYVTIPSPSKPLSPLYSPSAPDFEMTAMYENYSIQANAFTTYVSVNGDKAEEISAPALTAVPSSSHPKVDYRALAFKRTPSMLSSTVVPSSPPRSTTEFSF